MRRNMISAVILTAITVGAAFAVLPPDGWRVPEPVVVEAASQVGAGVVVNGQTVHSVWLDMQERELYYKRSSDAGFQWTGRIKLSNANPQVIPTALDIAFASDGGQWVYAAWTQYDPQEEENCVWFSYSDDNGITWTEPQTIASPYAPKSPQPVLGCDARGWAHLVYVGAEGTDPRIEGLIYKCFNNVARSWSQPGLVCEKAASPKIALLGNEPHIVTIYDAGGTCCFRHSRIVSGQWETTVIPETDDHLHHNFVVETSTGYLHLAATRQITPYRLRQFRSTDLGNTWSMSDLAEITDPYPGPSMVSDQKGLFISYSSGVTGEGKNLFEFYSSDHGSSWTGPQPLTQLSGNETSCAVASGRFGRVLAFDYDLPSEDVWFAADDDSLLSDSPEATAFTSGRHFVRDPMTNRLHLVYFSQNRPHYTYSDDEGSHWASYHIIDNIAQSSKDRGEFPSIGLYASASETFEPCVVYVSPASTGDTLKYRWWNPSTNIWEGFWFCNAGIALSAPSLTTFGEMVGVVVVAKNPALGQYVVRYYEFPYYAAGPGTPEIIQSGFLDTYASPCITVDGNWDKHAVYEENGEIIYERRVGPNTWVRDPPFPSSPLLWSATPFVEFYGDKLYVPYAEEDQPLGYYDVYRRWRDVQLPTPWSTRFNVSESPGIPSQCPVAAWGDFTVWAEQAPGDIEFDVKYYWHPEYQSGFVWMYPLHSDHLHTQMYYDWLGGSTVLLTAWTEGLMTAAPYRIAFRKMSFLPPPGDFGTYYAVSTGNPTPSFFCSKRDSFVRYQRYKVDFGKDELAYTLTLLNPTYPAYRMKVLSYFEGGSNRTEKVLIDGKEYATLDLKPNQLNTSELLIPKEYYRGDHKAVVTFRGSPVTKAGLVVQQLEQAKVGGYSGGGAQSVSTDKLVVDDIFEASPNPTKGAVAITYSLANPGDVKLRLYDASGRMIQELAHRLASAGTHQVALKQGLPAGIYFVTLEIDGKRIIRKVTIIR